MHNGCLVNTGGASTGMNEAGVPRLIKELGCLGPSHGSGKASQGSERPGQLVSSQEVAGMCQEAGLCSTSFPDILSRHTNISVPVSL